MAPTPRPKVITHEETHRRPVWEFSKGCNSYLRISRELDGAQNAIQGWCEHDPDMEPFSWKQANWDELFFCVKGSLKVIAEDGDGNKKELLAKEGESIFLPAGFTYTLEPTGEPSVNFWTVAPVPHNGIRPLSDVGFIGVIEVSNKLKEMAKEEEYSRA